MESTYGVPAGQRHPHLPNKTREHDTTWHSRYRFLVSSGGPCLPCPDRNWKELPLTRSPLLSQQSVNESDEAASLHYRSPHRQQRPGAVWTRSTPNCKTTNSVSHAKRSCALRPNLPIRSRYFRPHSHASPHKVMGVNMCLAAGLQHEIFTRFLDPAVRQQPPRCVRHAGGPRSWSPLLTTPLLFFFSRATTSHDIHLQEAKIAHAWLTTRASISGVVNVRLGETTCEVECLSPKTLFDQCHLLRPEPAITAVLYEGPQQDPAPTNARADY